jgi:hypothetical protein
VTLPLGASLVTKGQNLFIGGAQEGEGARNRIFRCYGSLELGDEGRDFLGAQDPSASQAELDAVMARRIMAGRDIGKALRPLGMPLRELGGFACKGHDFGGGYDKAVSYFDTQPDQHPGENIGQRRPCGPGVDAQEQRRPGFRPPLSQDESSKTFGHKGGQKKLGRRHGFGERILRPRVGDPREHREFPLRRRPFSSPRLKV